METKIIRYKMTQDIQGLLNKERDKFNQEQIDKTIEFNRNKERLLPYVLQMVESIVTIHNHKCDRKETFGGAPMGLLGYGKRDLKNELDLATKDFNFDSKGESFELKGYPKIWLNTNNKHIATPNLEYSLMNPYLQVAAYGYSIEAVVQDCINLAVRRFTDNWE